MSGASRSDRRRLLITAFLRAAATSLVGVELGIYLAELGLDTASIGAIASVGLSGAAAAALAVTLFGDRLGRRRSLVATSLLGALGAAALLLASSPLLLGAAAFVGMVNAMGRDRGAASILEQATLPSTASDAGRTRAFAWYNALQDAGHAVGSLLAGLPELLQRSGGLAPATSHRAALVAVPLLLGASLLFYLRLSPGVEAGGAAIGVKLSAATSRVLAKISLLFGLDGLGGGFLVTTLVSYFFFERFGAGPAAIGVLFFTARMANVVSHFGAAVLARRFGLVNTMVFTHIPASLLLVAVALVPDFATAAAIFVLRELLVEMDVPTRQSYVMAVVEPEARTTASGVTNLVRLAAWAAGPVVAGGLMDRFSLAAPLVLGAGIKIVYDLLLWASFRNLRPPEERSPG